MEHIIGKDVILVYVSPYGPWIGYQLTSCLSVSYYSYNNHVTWVRNYLSNRLQYVEINGNKSLTVALRCGVPQGSILGPLLYLTYVNDIGNSCQCNILSFADDTTVYNYFAFRY